MEADNKVQACINSLYCCALRYMISDILIIKGMLQDVAIGGYRNKTTHCDEKYDKSYYEQT